MKGLEIPSKCRQLILNENNSFKVFTDSHSCNRYIVRNRLEIYTEEIVGDQFIVTVKKQDSLSTETSKNTGVLLLQEGRPLLRALGRDLLPRLRHLARAGPSHRAALMAYHCTQYDILEVEKNSHCE